MKNKCVFLDRDGVLCAETNYMHAPDQFHLIPGAVGALKRLKSNGYLLVVATNQSGVARGYFTEEDVQRINYKMAEELEKQGVSLDGVYYCPHHPEGKGVYKKDCECRKPKPGMLELAARELNIDLNSSYMIGDKESDIMAGMNAGCKSILVATGYGKKELERLLSMNHSEPDFIADNLYEASEIILSEGERT